MKHTPKPWSFHQNGDGSYSILGEKIIEKEYRWIASFIQNGELCTEEQIANIKLMTASPDLAEICYDILKAWHAKKSNFYKQEPDYLEKIRKALIKAGI